VRCTRRPSNGSDPSSRNSSNRGASLRRRLTLGGPRIDAPWATLLSIPSATWHGYCRRTPRAGFPTSSLAHRGWMGGPFRPPRGSGAGGTLRSRSDPFPACLEPRTPTVGPLLPPAPTFSTLRLVFPPRMRLAGAESFLPQANEHNRSGEALELSDFATSSAETGRSSTSHRENLRRLHEGRARCEPTHRGGNGPAGIRTRVRGSGGLCDVQAILRARAPHSRPGAI
jgi:hypothetical protein